MANKSSAKDIIFEVWEANPNWLPKEIQKEVHKRLGLRRSKNNTYPGLRTVQDYVKKFKDNLGQLVEEDKPWSIAASVKYKLSPEDTKDLFDIWRASLAMGSPISIRQAKWIVHIRKLFYQPVSTGNPYSDKVNRNLWLIRQSWLYSILERASRIMGEKYFDTTSLDAASFMSPLEHMTALKLGKVSSIDYSQEALAKIEKHGTPLMSPPYSITSIEQAVWSDVRTTPPPDMELMDYISLDVGLGEKPLSEEDDLVSAYWLNYLSKGPKWKSLDYFEQRRIRLDLRKWVQQNSNMFIRDYYFKNGVSTVFNPKLLRQVGYEITPEENELWYTVYEKALKAKHDGWEALPADVQQKFIHDEQTDNDLILLEDADNQSRIKQEQREQEFIELVEQKGGVPVGKTRKEKETFWKTVRDEWIKKYPTYAHNKLRHPQGEDFELEYATLMKRRKRNNKEV